MSRRLTSSKAPLGVSRQVTRAEMRNSRLKRLEAEVTSYVINAIRYLTYVQLFYGEYRADGQYDERSVTHMEIRIRYDNLPKLPCRLFAPSCRSLCGFDLRRWHVTCIFSCLLRRVHYGKMPPKIPVRGYVLWIHLGRRFECVKTPLLKRVMTIAEQLAK
jgi:hypothetical protein